MKDFALKQEPYDYIISVHINNLFATFGEEIVRGYINQNLEYIPECHYLIHRHIENLINTYSADIVSNCWNDLFRKAA